MMQAGGSQGGLSEYERQRAATIAANEAMMATLGLSNYCLDAHAVTKSADGDGDDRIGFDEVVPAPTASLPTPASAAAAAAVASPGWAPLLVTRALASSLSASRPGHAAHFVSVVSDNSPAALPSPTPLRSPGSLAMRHSHACPSPPKGVFAEHIAARSLLTLATAFGSPRLLDLHRQESPASAEKALKIKGKGKGKGGAARPTRSSGRIKGEAPELGRLRPKRAGKGACLSIALTSTLVFQAISVPKLRSGAAALDLGANPYYQKLHWCCGTSPTHTHHPLPAHPRTPHPHTYTPTHQHASPSPATTHLPPATTHLPP